MSVRTAIHNARQTIASFDAENTAKSTELSGGQRAGAVGRNLFEATLETLNALPATHMVSGPASVFYGLGKMVYGGGALLLGFAGALIGGGGNGQYAGSYISSGLKTAALGGMAMIPVVGWIPNAAAAALDVVDAANAALPPTKAE